MKDIYLCLRLRSNLVLSTYLANVAVPRLCVDFVWYIIVHFLFFSFMWLVEHFYFSSVNQDYEFFLIYSSFYFPTCFLHFLSYVLYCDIVAIVFSQVLYNKFQSPPFSFLIGVLQEFKKTLCIDVSFIDPYLCCMWPYNITVHVFFSSSYFNCLIDLLNQEFLPI